MTFNERSTADELWETLEFRDLQDEIKGPTMTGNVDCSFYCSNSCRTDPSSCRTQAYCSTQVGCITPGFGKKK